MEIGPFTTWRLVISCYGHWCLWWVDIGACSSSKLEPLVYSLVSVVHGVMLHQFMETGSSSSWSLTFVFEEDSCLHFTELGELFHGDWCLWFKVVVGSNSYKQVSLLHRNWCLISWNLVSLAHDYWYFVENWSSAFCDWCLYFMVIGAIISGLRLPPSYGDLSLKSLVTGPASSWRLESLFLRVWGL